MLFCVQANALESLSYSGRLVQTNGAPVVGPVNIKADLAYTDNLGVTLCTQTIPGVTLIKGVFHLKLSFDCSVSGKTLNQVLSQVPTNESVAIQITDLSNAKSYSYQAIHSMPFANVASQLVQMGAGEGEFLKWDNTLKKWKPGTVSGASGGTVTNVSVTSPLSVATPTSTPSITLPQATGSQSGYLSAADWNTFNSKEGTIAGGTATQFYRGDKSWQTLDTAAVPENVNLYFTNARALGVPLTGFATAAGAIVATDTTLQAFGKAQGQINTINSAAANYLIKNSTDSITGLVNVGTTGLLQLVYVPVGLNDATNKAYVDSEVGTKVSKAGDTMSGVLTLDNDLRIKGGSNHVTVRGHASSANYNLVLPSGAGSSGQFLQTDGSGNLSWVAQSTTAAPTGAAGGDLAGTYPNPTVPALANKISTTLSSGNILVGNASNVATGVVVSGDATLSNTGVLTLANSGATAGTFKSVTVDAKGRVTAGTNPTTLAGYGITDTIVTGVSVTAPITNTGTASVPLIGMPAATTSVNGYLTSTDWTTFNNKQDAITSASNINTGSLTSNLQGGLILNPYNTAAGNTGEIRFKELVANGTNYTGFKAADVLAGNVIYTLPSADGTNGQVLTTNSTGGLSWTTVSTSSSSLTGDIGGTIGANTIGAGKVTLTHLSATGTKDNTTYLRGDNTFTSFAADVRASVLTGLSTSTNAVITATDSVLSSLGKLQKQISDFAISAVGGDLSGNLPNPTVVKIQGRAVSSSAPSPGQVLRFNAGGTSWDPTFLLMGDLKSSVSGNLFPGTGCAVNQTLQYAIGTDSFSCVNIDSIDAGKITTGTIAAARLPSSATYWQAATGGINYASGNVGIGTATPVSKLEVKDGYAQVNRTETTGQPNFYNAFNSESNSLALRYTEDAIGVIPADAWQFRLGNTAKDIIFSHYDSFPLLSMKTTGYVGIGTATPVTNLEVSGGNVDGVLTISADADNSNENDNARISIIQDGTGATSTGMEIGFSGEDTGSSGNIFSLAKRYGGAVDWSTFNINTQNGYVGIGTSNPQTNLHVNGASAGPIMARIQNTTSTGYTSVRLFNDQNDIYRALEIDYTGSTYATSALTGGPVGEAASIATTGAYPLVLGSNNTARMVINSSGNVGIGTNTPTQKLEVVGNIQSYDTYFTSVTFADGWAVGDYKELVVTGASGASGSSNNYKVMLSTTRSNWTEASTFETIVSHSDPDVWREVPVTIANYYTTFAYRCFTIDANTTAYAIKFRVRAIRPSSDCSPSSSGPMPILFKFSSESYNGAWTALTATGSGATVSGYRTTRGSEWNLYTGHSRNAGLPTITAKEGRVGIGTNNPGNKLEAHGRIISVNPSGLSSGGDYIGFATETGDLPGYPASAYSVIKTNNPYIYFSAGGSYSSYISAGGTYTAVSDRNKKENFVELDYDDIRQRIDELPLTMWNYKAENDSIKHIGPMAQDFHRLFGLNGSNDKMIANMDTTGVALAGVKSLSKVINDQEAEIKSLKTKNAELEARLKKIEAYLTRKPASK